MRKFQVFLFCIITLILTSCQPAASVPDTMVPSQTPETSSTPTIHPTVTNTPTLQPTKTAIPPTPTVESPAFLDEYMDGVRITSLATFDNGSPLSYAEKLVKVEDGMLNMKGEGYTGGAEADSSFQEGQGIIFDFQIDSVTSSDGFEFETFFAIGDWWTSGYKRFGVYIVPSPQADMWVGTKGTGKNLTGNLKIVPDHTYQIMIAIGKDASFLCTIWDPQKPQDKRIYRISKGGNWSDINWRFQINGARGDMFVDNFMTFKFDGYK